MDVDIYTVTTSKFVVVPKGTQPVIPGLPPYTGLKLFKTKTLKAGENRIGIDSDEAIAHIKRDGYFVLG